MRGLKRYYINTDYFSSLDTPNKAYWFGYLVADGCMSSSRTRLLFGQQSSEGYLVYEFGSIFEQPPRIIIRKNKGAYTSHIFQLDCVQVYNDLLRLGLLPNKSHRGPSQFSRNIPLTLVNHFARGLLDGDGTVTHYRKQPIICWTGSFEGLMLIAHNAPVTNKHVPKKYNSTWMLRYGKRDDLVRIYNWLYKDADIYCQRKQKLFESNLHSGVVQGATKKIDLTELAKRLVDIYGTKACGMLC